MHNKSVCTVKEGGPCVTVYLDFRIVAEKRVIMRKKLLALVLSAMLAVTAFTGCGDNTKNTTKTSNTQSEEKEGFVYVPTYFDWGFEKSDNDWINTYGIRNGHMLGMYQTYDETTYESNQELLVMNLSDGALTRIPVKLENENQYVNQFTTKDDGSVLVCAEEYKWDEKTQVGESTYTIMHMDVTGTVLSTMDMTAVCKEMEDKYEWAHPQNMIVDGDGVLYIQFDQEIVALNEEGTKIFGVETSNYIHNMGVMPDGNIYIVYYGQDGTEMAVIDKNTQALGTAYKVSNSLNGFFEVAEGNVLYYSDGSAVCSWDLATGESKVLFDWLDSDINGNYVNGISCKDEDTIFAYYSDWQTNEETFMKLVKTDRSQVKEKKTITLATLTNTGSDMMADIVAFNRANEEYRIDVVMYLDQRNMSTADYQNYEQFINDAVTRMKNDLTGNNPPDIICLSDTYISTEDLAVKGLLEEITPYLEKAGYSLDDFVQGVVNSYKLDGKLYGLPTRFSLYTAVADSAYVGTEPGWTLAEVQEVVKNMPEGMQFLSGTTQSSFVNQCLMFGYDTFIDSVNSQCHFDSPEFKTLLEIAKAFPKEYDYTGEEPSDPILLSSGELLMTVENIYDLDGIQLCQAYFGDKTPTFIGLPGASGNGTLIMPDGAAYALCSKSDEKDAAAQFIVGLLTEEYDESDQSSWGFPVLQKALDAYIADEIDVEYLKDEKGELILDENGNPISTEGGHGIGMGDWEYSYRPCNQEDADILLELINGANGTYNYNTELFSIIMEELEPYFSGQKSVDEVAGIIQNRINLYLIENS